MAATTAWRRKQTLARFLLLLPCPGLDVSWMKAQLGKTFEWLGVTLSLTTKDGRPGVTVTIPASECTDIVKEIGELLDAAGMAQEK